MQGGRAATILVENIPSSVWHWGKYLSKCVCERSNNIFLCNLLSKPQMTQIHAYLTNNGNKKRLGFSGLHHTMVRGC